MPDHVHMLLNVPLKLAVSSAVGYIKGKSAIHIARHYLKRDRNCAGQAFWGRGYFVDTVGRDTETIRRCIAEQDKEDQRLDRMKILFIIKNRTTTRNTKELKNPALSGCNHQAHGFAGVFEYNIFSENNYI